MKMTYDCHSLVPTSLMLLMDSGLVAARHTEFADEVHQRVATHRIISGKPSSDHPTGVLAPISPSSSIQSNARVTPQMVLSPRVSSGDPWLYVMLYQHLFFEHSALVASTIARGVSPDMFQQGAAGNKRNALTVIFQILRNVFNYNPPLTTQQFSTTDKYSKIKVNQHLYSYSFGLVKPMSGRSNRLAICVWGCSNVSMCLDVLKLILDLKQLMKNKTCISNFPTNKKPGDLPQPHLKTKHITTITQVKE
ncbi:unnamed protein product [Timema podura]|uniref:Centrosomal CEP44 domain-containing protein n=1 Tax=Timema podura TaxID=61482 RepID=A0ABN7NRZ3_TIMPD|nr:unnamed protein product [Timema podura]